MKKWIITQSILVLVVIFIGQIGKSRFKDFGLMTFSSNNDINIVGNSHLSSVWDDDSYSNMMKYKDSYISDTDYAPIVVVAKSTGNIFQRYGCFGQEINIVNVIKGNKNLLNKTTYVYKNNGFQVNYIKKEYYGKLVYSGVLNIMKPKHYYLIFLKPLELNGYLSKDVYRLFEPLFGYLDYPWQLA